MNECEIQIIRAWVFRIEIRRIKISEVRVEQDGNCGHIHWCRVHMRFKKKEGKGRGIE